MLDRIRHRGPDATNSLTIPLQHGSAYLGHHLLRIIDPSDQNKQPFQSPDGRYSLIYNGELYNFQALKYSLQQSGVQFRTQGDTEVLLHWLITHGIEGIPKINGMFACVLTDNQTGNILLARDRFGVKPLYYARAGNTFLACSEIKGILASELIPRKPNVSQIGHYLRYRHALAPETFFQDIYELPPGTSMLIHANQSEASPLPYPTESDTAEGHSGGVHIVREMLLAAVERQLIADVPLGIFLSGGIDSTLILALMREIGRKHIPAFVMGADPSLGAFGSNDLAYARKAAAQYGAALTEITIPSDLLNRVDHYAASLDQPIADSAGMLTSLLSQHAVQSVRVVLSGAGADEFFGGYERHLAFQRYLKHKNWLIPMAPLLKATTSLLPDGFAHPLRKKTRLVRKFLNAIDQDPRTTFNQFRSLQINQTTDTNPWPSETLSPLDAALWQDQHQYLVSDILAMSDQTTMAHGLEMRVPYLDNDLAALSHRIGGTALLQRGRKWMLKEILTDLGGESFVNRPKEGFGIPAAGWFRSSDGLNRLQQIQAKGHALYEWLDHQEVSRLLSAHRSQKRDYTSELMALLILFVWWDHTF